MCDWRGLALGILRILVVGRRVLSVMVFCALKFVHGVDGAIAGNTWVSARRYKIGARDHACSTQVPLMFRGRDSLLYILLISACYSCGIRGRLKKGEM